MNRLLSALFLSLPTSCLYASGPLALHHLDESENKRALALLMGPSKSGVVVSTVPPSSFQVNVRGEEPIPYADYARMMDIFLKNEERNAELFLQQHKNDPIGEGNKRSPKPLHVVSHGKLRAFFGCFWSHA